MESFFTGSLRFFPGFRLGCLRYGRNSSGDLAGGVFFFCRSFFFRPGGCRRFYDVDIVLRIFIMIMRVFRWPVSRKDPPGHCGNQPQDSSADDRQYQYPFVFPTGLVCFNRVTFLLCLPLRSIGQIRPDLIVIRISCFSGWRLVRDIFDPGFGRLGCLIGGLVLPFRKDFFLFRRRNFCLSGGWQGITGSQINDRFRIKPFDAAQLDRVFYIST